MEDPDIKESLEYLEEMIGEYEKLVQNIGKNGLNASLLLNYRDEVQITMHELRAMDVDLKEYWYRIVTLDNNLRKQAQQFVNEIGYHNFKQYQIVNDPPPDHWWWYLNRTAQPPQEEKKSWKFWKK
jgi:hypothetical protein